MMPSRQGGRIEKIARSLRASAVAGGSEEVMAEFGVRLVPCFRSISIGC